jgi:phospholipase/carboxylesterase
VDHLALRRARERNPYCWAVLKSLDDKDRCTQMMGQPSGRAALSLVHRTVIPRKGDGPYPTLIALHGRGSDEGDLLGLAPYLDDRLLWISPRAPLDLPPGYEWYRLASIGQPVEPTFAKALRQVNQFVDEALAAYPVDRQRVFLFGFSQGGMMSYAHSLSRPGLTRGVLIHSSYLPLPSIQAAGTVAPDGVRGKPYLVIHGQHDPLIPVARGREARDWLSEAGADVTYLEYPMGHTVSEQSIAAMNSWLAVHLDDTRPTGPAGQQA